VITVGAMKDLNTTSIGDDDITTYSSRGPTWPDHLLKPDLVAPGNKIISLRLAGGFLDTAYPELRIPARTYTTDPVAAGGAGDYFELSGTSMAAPIVTGVVAQMLQAHPGLSPATVKARLMKSASKNGGSPFLFGAGMVNLPGALAATGTATSARPRGAPGPRAARARLDRRRRLVVGRHRGLGRHRRVG
jgi:serine protease AprX